MDDNQFFQNLLDRFQVNVQCESASLYLLDPTGTRLEVKAASGLHKQPVEKKVHYGLGEGITGRIAQQGKFDQNQWGRPGKIIGIPLKTPEGKVVGVFKAENKLGENRIFTDVDVAIAESIADLATMAITFRQEKEKLGRFIYA